MRFVCFLRAKCGRDEGVACNVARPCFGQRSCQREQHRATDQRHHCIWVANCVTARVHYEPRGSQQCFDVCQQQASHLASCDQPCGRCVQDADGTLDFAGQCGDSRTARAVLCASKCCPRRFYSKSSNRNPCEHQLVCGP